MKSDVFKFILKEISRAEQEYMNIHPPINALVTPLNGNQVQKLFLPDTHQPPFLKDVLNTRCDLAKITLSINNSIYAHDYLYKQKIKERQI